jgi:acetyltransferase-like isoleucine patch superfamily enzyme
VRSGVTIGARAIVSAMAFVTEDVPPDTIVSGNPAQVVKHLA